MSKGSSFERDTCRALSLWWTHGQRDDVFWRNRTRVTSKTPNRERQLGDMTATHTSGLPFIEVFNAELKIGYSKTKAGKKHRVIPWDLLDLIDGKGRTFIGFWEQTLEDAVVSNRIPMLIFKRDYHTPVVCLFHTDVEKLEDLNNDCMIYPYLSATLGLIYTETIDLYSFDKFFEWLRPETVRVLAVQKDFQSKRKIIQRADAEDSQT